MRFQDAMSMLIGGLGGLAGWWVGIGLYREGIDWHVGAGLGLIIWLVPSVIWWAKGA